MILMLNDFKANSGQKTSKIETEVTLKKLNTKAAFIDEEEGKADAKIKF